jgi:hypothetical protein
MLWRIPRRKGKMSHHDPGKSVFVEKRLARIALVLFVTAVMVVFVGVRSDAMRVDDQGQHRGNSGKLTEAEQQTQANAQRMLEEGKQTFRFDTFGDEAFWGDTLQLHRAIEGERFGGVGPGVSPKTALAVGLKVDSEALPQPLIAQLKQGRVNLDDPATTLALLKLNAVLGVKGTFKNDGSLQAVGITCALCHSTVDNSFAPGIGHRLDGWANRDLNVGAIIALAPNLQPFADLLGVSQDTVRTVLLSWGPGKFDAELILDAASARVWSGGSEPAYVDRLGFSDALERFRRKPGDARVGNVLRSTSQRCSEVSDCSARRLWQRS